MQVATQQAQPIKFRKSRKCRPERTCFCNAYPFPHRATSGACMDPGEEPSSCGECSHSVAISDPYGTGDSWFSLAECEAPHSCPWKKD